MALLKKSEIKSIWPLQHSCGLLLGLGITFVVNSLLPLLLFTVISFGLLIHSRYEEIKRFRPLGGYANWVTCFRLLLILILMIFRHQIDPILLVTGFVFSLCLDGLDGLIARRTKTISKLGADLDMETDAVFVFFLSLILSSQTGHWWLLTIGLWRYIYVIILAVSSVKIKEEPSSFLKKTSTVYTISALLLGLLVSEAWGIFLLLVAAASTSVSFTHSLYFQFQSKG